MKISKKFKDVVLASSDADRDHKFPLKIDFKVDPATGEKIRKMADLIQCNISVLMRYAVKNALVGKRFGGSALDLLEASEYNEAKRIINHAYLILNEIAVVEEIQQKRSESKTVGDIMTRTMECETRRELAAAIRNLTAVFSEYAREKPINHNTSELTK